MTVIMDFDLKKREKQIKYERSVLKELSIKDLKAKVAHYFGSSQLTKSIIINEGMEEACFDVAIEAFLLLFVVFLLLAGVVAAVRGGAARPWLALARNAVCWFLGATALAAAVLPRDSWQFWSGTFLAADRAGHPEQTANQSLRGLLARLLHTADPGLWWLAAALLTGAAGLAVAVLAGLRSRPAWAATACGMTALLVSPVSWSHHWVWSVPAAVLVLDEAVRAGEWWRRTGAAVLTGLFFTYALWWVPHGPERPELHQGPAEFALSALYPLAALGFLVVAWRVALRSGAVEVPPAGQVPEQREPAAAERGRAGRQAVAKE